MGARQEAPRALGCFRARRSRRLHPSRSKRRPLSDECAQSAVWQSARCVCRHGKAGTFRIRQSFGLNSSSADPTSISSAPVFMLRQLCRVRFIAFVGRRPIGTELEPLRYGRNNPRRNIDDSGFKVLPAVLAEAVSKMNALPGGTLYLDFAGIQGLHSHQSLGTWANFDLWHSDHTAANSVIIPNKGIVSGFFRAFFGLANKDQVDTGQAVVAAAKAAGEGLAFDTYSNGVNAAGKVAGGMSAGDLQSATVDGPNPTPRLLFRLWIRPMGIDVDFRERA